MRISDWSSDVCSSDLSSVEMHANRSEASRLPDSLLRTADICFRSNNLERKSTIIVFVRAKGGTDASQACHDPRHRDDFRGGVDPHSRSVDDGPEVQGGSKRAPRG